MHFPVRLGMTDEDFELWLGRIAKDRPFQHQVSLRRSIRHPDARYTSECRFQISFMAAVQLDAIAHSC